MATSSASAAIDYEVLWQNTTSTLAPLSYLKISPLRVKAIAGGEVIVGGFGDVEQAKLRTSLFRSDLMVALKKLRPAGSRNQRIRVLASLARELSVWSKLDHPNILALGGFYFDESSLKTAWIATLWNKNGNIKTYLDATCPDKTTRLKLALGTARGLAYLHGLSTPVCHGDIKMENTLIDDDGNPRLCDFGLAKVLEDVPSGLTTTQTAGYTLRYAAPELTGSDGASHTLASDVWAWGCLFVGIMTDLVPYASEGNERAVLRAIMDNKLPANIASLDLPDTLKSLLTGCWKYAPGARPPLAHCCREICLQFLPLYLDQKPRNIPSEYRTYGDGWYAIHVPDSFECEFVEDPGVRYFLESSHQNKFAFSPDGRHLAIQDGATVVFRDVKTAKIQCTLNAPGQSPITKPKLTVTAIGFNFDGSLLATGHENGVIYIWNVSQENVLSEVPGHRKRISSLTFVNSDDEVLVSMSETEDVIQAWNVSYGAAFYRFELRDLETVVGSPHHRFIIAFTKSQVLALDVERGRRYKLPSPERLGCIAFAPNGWSLLFSLFLGRGMTYWDLDPLMPRWPNHDPPEPDTEEPVALVAEPLGGQQHSIGSISISSDGLLAASGSWEMGSLVLWNLRTRQPIARIEGDQTFYIQHVTFRPGSTASDGAIAFTSSSKNLHLLRYKLSL